jgi:hypothetical protein
MTSWTANWVPCTLISLFVSMLCSLWQATFIDYLIYLFYLSVGTRKAIDQLQLVPSGGDVRGPPKQIPAQRHTVWSLPPKD